MKKGQLLIGKNMHLLLLPIFFLPSVLGGCNRFTTTNRWTAIRSLDTPGYGFLEDGPVSQVSDFINCNSNYASQNPCSGNASLCSLEASGSIIATARFNMQPTTSNEKDLEAFFNVVKKAADANGKGNAESPRYSTCGDVKLADEEAGFYRKFCTARGDRGWIRYYPQYTCVNGTAEECTDGPFESGTMLVVCGVGTVSQGLHSFYSNRTTADGSYAASDINPSLNTSMTCAAGSMAVTGFEVSAWSLGFTALAMITGLIL
ncbi:hypothetical protein TWF481_011275 [Arthrobotrys musiformis]|uniref:Uncharacterized protein n=1 Tax=Arthrobotrys musiformis TaxID=47236 RepID=A0AAV9VY23_9PEZI